MATTLTHEQRTQRQRGHLRLVVSNETPRLRAVGDPAPGPRDAEELVARFDAVLPKDPGVDGVFLLGAE